MSGNIRILVIDDHKEHADGLVELLNLNGFEATQAYSGRTGLRLALENPVDAILMDINLPDMSGYEVCRRLREDARTADMVIIFHTGSSAPYYDQHLGDAFLTYPVEFPVLFNVIRGCIARRRSVMA